MAVPDPAPAGNAAQDIPLAIAFEDEHLIVVDKPAGLVVHPACGNLDGTLVNALLHHCRGSLSGIGGVERPGIVHRIDKDTSGLMVAAKTDRAHAGLAGQFAAHSIDRRYRAIVAGAAADGRGPDRGAPRPQHRQSQEDGGGGRWPRQACGDVLADRGAAARGGAGGMPAGNGPHATRSASTWPRSAIRCSAIRSTAVAAANRDAVLDALGFRRQALHAARLGFVHPITGEALTFESDIPPDMRQLIDELWVEQAMMPRRTSGAVQGPVSGPGA